MTRLPGRPLSESWPELSPAQRDLVVRQLANFTKQLSHVSPSSAEDARGDEDAEHSPDSWTVVGSLLVGRDCQSFGLSVPTNDRAPNLDLELAPLLLPKRHGANNLRPVTSKVRCYLTLAHPSVRLLISSHPLAYLQAQPTTTTTTTTTTATSSLLLLDGADDDNDDDYLSCYEVLLPTPSPPSSPHHVQFFPAGDAATSTVVKSCEDWLAGIKSGMPEVVIIEVRRAIVAQSIDIRTETHAPNFSFFPHCAG
jgi:hypothetical protein